METASVWAAQSVLECVRCSAASAWRWLAIAGLWLLPLLAAPSSTAAEKTNGPAVVLVVGAAGEPAFSSNFVRQVELWSNACERGHAKRTCIGLPDSKVTSLDAGANEGETKAGSDRELLKRALADESGESREPLWLVFIGHGTFDGKEARFNLRGHDLTAADLREWLQPLRRPLVFIDTTSASAPFLNQLSATNRVIVTATRSGNEQNFAHFGLGFAEALSDPESDLDKDGQTSVLEAFISASARTAEFYRREGRLATEHALLDDNGDALGTPADWFRGVRATKKAEGSASVDGARAHQVHLVLSPEEQKLPAEARGKRDALELSINQLREMKSKHPEAEYYRELEKLLLQLADAYGNNL